MGRWNAWPRPRTLRWVSATVRGGSSRRPSHPGRPCSTYTDGLVERRDEPLDVGISRLADVFATTNGSVWGAVSDVLEAMAAPGGERRDDDVAVVIAHHRLPAPPS